MIPITSPYMLHCRDAGWPHSLGRCRWVEASSSFLPCPFLLVGWFLYSLLGSATYTLPSCWSGWLRNIIHSIAYFKEGHVHNQLTHSSDAAIYCQGKSSIYPLGVKFSILCNSCGHLLDSFLSLVITSSLSIFSELYTSVGVCRLVTTKGSTIISACYLCASLPSWCKGLGSGRGILGCFMPDGSSCMFCLGLPVSRDSEELLVSGGCWRGAPGHAEEQLIQGGGKYCTFFCPAAAAPAFSAPLGALLVRILPSRGSSQGKQLCVFMNTQLRRRNRTRMEKFGCGNCKMALGKLAAAQRNPNRAETIIHPPAAPACSLHACGSIPNEEWKADHDVFVG